MLGILDEGYRGDNALGEDEGANAEVHLQAVSIGTYRIVRIRTMEAPNVSHFANDRGNTGKSTARIHKKVNNSM